MLVCDGRGEAASHLAGRYAGGQLDVLASQPLPHSLGLFYEAATSHLGFVHSSDEYKVMALASYGTPRFAHELARLVYADGDGGFRTEAVHWDGLAKRRTAGEPLTEDHADLAASVQRVTEDVLLELARWLHGRTGGRRPGHGRRGGAQLRGQLPAAPPRARFERIWVQPAAGDAGTALGGALCLASASGRRAAADAGRLPGPRLDRRRARGLARRPPRWPYERPASIADAVAAELAADRIVAWFQGRSEYGPRALGGRSLLAHPGRSENLDRLNAVKGREEFRPVAPMVLTEAGGRDLPTARCPARTCCSCTTSRRRGGDADPGRGARGRHRPGADGGPRARSRWSPDARRLRAPAPGCRWSSTPA